MCAGLPPNDKTPIMGWKHVTAGGKETCHGDYGAPLICDIDGTATLVGVHSIGDLTECGLDGRPAIHTQVQEVKPWIDFVINKHGPPAKCFEITLGTNIEGALGDQIVIYRNEEIINEDTKPMIEPLLKPQQSKTSRPYCIMDTKEGERFTFKLKKGGKDNVSPFISKTFYFTFDCLNFISNSNVQSCSRPSLSLLTWSK